MKRLLTAIFFLLPLAAAAQSEPLVSPDDSLPTLVERIIDKREGGYKIRKIRSHINLEFYTSANAYFTEGEFDDISFKLNRVRLEIKGKLNDKLSYHFRQSYNKYSNPYSTDNLSSSIEYANITWHAGRKFNLVAGKQFVSFGG